MNGDVLTVKEVAQRLAVCEMTIYRMNRRGAFPGAYKEKQHLYIPVQDVDAVLLRRVLTPGAGPVKTVLTPAEIPSEPAPAQAEAPAMDEPVKTVLTPQTPPAAPPQPDTPSSPAPGDLVSEQPPQTAEMSHFRVRFGEWFIYERQYIKAPKHHEAWARLKLFIWNIGITGGGFFEGVFRRIREASEQHRAQVLPPANTSRDPDAEP